MADQLRAVGLKVRVTPVTGAAWMERAGERHEFDLTLIGGNQGPDPENLNARFGSRGAFQIMGYESPSSMRRWPRAPTPSASRRGPGPTSGRRRSWPATSPWCRWPRGSTSPSPGAGSRASPGRRGAG